MECNARALPFKPVLGPRRSLACHSHSHHTLVRGMSEACHWHQRPFTFYSHPHSHQRRVTGVSLAPEAIHILIHILITLSSEAAFDRATTMPPPPRSSSRRTAPSPWRYNDVTTQARSPFPTTTPSAPRRCSTRPRCALKLSRSTCKVCHK